MKTENRKLNKQSGSALILVVVVTVLLAVVGVMFVMISRASELETAAVVQGRDLDNAVDTVVAKINEVLVEDLFGQDDKIVNADSTDEPYDAVGTGDFWLASLEPVLWDDNEDNSQVNNDYAWRRITDLYDNNFGNVPQTYFDPQSQKSDISEIDPAEWDIAQRPELNVNASTVLTKVIKPKDRTYPVDPSGPDWAKDYAGARADADGDGVADSRWVQLPHLTGSRGESVFAAVRIVDNCAMLNLNVAHCFYQEDYADNMSFFEKPWFENNVFITPYHDNQSTGSGRYLTEINYLPFLRGRDLNGEFFDSGADGGGDDWYNLMITKGFWNAGQPLDPSQCQAILMDIENPVSGFRFYDIGDELELRNRYLLTSKTESLLEQRTVTNYTLDSGGGAYSALKVPREDKLEDGAPHIARWNWRVNPGNFDKWIGPMNPSLDPIPYKYDRRHVCTVYSYDRVLGQSEYPLLDSELDGLAVGLAWTPQQREQVERIFRPVGLVTTNIETLFINYKYDDESPSILYPFATSYNNVETRRKILHLLFAFREYYYQKNGGDLTEAARSAAQLVANLIDYSDDDALNSQIPGESEGPFYHSDYGQQANIDCTFITKEIIDDMITEVSIAYGIVIPQVIFDFGLSADDIVFGYERQPFISEVFWDWNGGGGEDGALEAFAIELVNPYPQTIDMEGWALKIGDDTIIPFDSDPVWDVPEIGSGRAVYHGSYLQPSMTIAGGIVPTPDIPELDDLDTRFFAFESVEIQLLRPAPAEGDYICVDRISNDELRAVFQIDFGHSLQRDDDNWKFIYEEYASPITIFEEDLPYEIGTENPLTVSGLDIFRIGVPDDGLPLTRWHELETLSIYGNGPEDDPNQFRTVSNSLANLDEDSVPYFDLAGDSSDLLDYICTINRLDHGSLPGRININTAPVHVIAAAIPPILVDPNAATNTAELSALELAQEIVNYRRLNGPFVNLSDLLNIPAFRQYDSGGQLEGVNVGAQSIDNDIEEEHWILSNLANKLTVRSDVFTAYILVRLGTDGPQRRMIGIFDRSQVWDKNDLPKLVALHPVPNPR